MTVFLVSLAGRAADRRVLGQVLHLPRRDRPRRRRRLAGDRHGDQLGDQLVYYFAMPAGDDLRADPSDDRPLHSPVLVTAVVATAMVALVVLFVLPDAVSPLGATVVVRWPSAAESFLRIAGVDRASRIAGPAVRCTAEVMRPMTPGINRIKTWVLIAAHGRRCSFCSAGWLGGDEAARRPACCSACSSRSCSTAPMYWFSDKIAVATHAVEAGDRAGIPRSCTHRPRAGRRRRHADAARSTSGRWRSRTRSPPAGTRTTRRWP